MNLRKPLFKSIAARRRCSLRPFDLVVLLHAEVMVEEWAGKWGVDISWRVDVH